MPSTLDLDAVRQFTDELTSRIRECENDEGTVCSSLQKRISFHTQLCSDLRYRIYEWARSVFSGVTGVDLQIEVLWKTHIKNVLDRAGEVAAYGRILHEQCYELDGLDQLHYQIASLTYLLNNWVSPRLAVSPAPRVRLSDAGVQEAIENLEKLSPLPHDWLPSNPEQLAIYMKQRA